MHQDNRKNFFLKEMFPNQFNTIPRIIIWTLIFIADIVLVLWIASLLGFSIAAAASSRILLIVYLVIAFGLFCLESFLYNLIWQ